MKYINNEKGQALIVIVLAAVVLFGFAALSIDGSMVFSDKRHAQNAADTSAMAAALARTRGSDLYAAGKARSTSNGYDNNGASNVVEITTTPTPNGTCLVTGVDIKVKITSYVKTTFARILGWTKLTNVVTATARACDISGGKPFYSGSSVWSTQTNDACNGTSSQSIHNGGSGNVNLYGGGLGSSDPANKCIDLDGGHTQLLKNDDGTCATITTVGSSATNLGGVGGTCYTSANIITNAQFISPPADLGITCSGNGSQSGTTLSPGNYSGSFPPNNVTTLNPGTYCLSGNFKLTGGTLTGTGVTIVMNSNSGSINWGGNSTVQLSAPTSGDYKGLLIYYPLSNTTGDLSMVGTGDNIYSGTILAQNSHCKYAGNSNGYKQTIQFICGSWETTGTADLNIVYNASLFYSPTTPPNISLLQ
ncbi:MAG: Tad domain-containing protein [Chloroflexota bacterium]